MDGLEEASKQSLILRKDAIGKASDIQRAYGFNINKTPIRITEETISFTPFGDRSMTRADVSTPIQSGEMDIVASIKAVFAYS